MSDSVDSLTFYTNVITALSDATVDVTGEKQAGSSMPTFTKSSRRLGNNVKPFLLPCIWSSWPIRTDSGRIKSQMARVCKSEIFKALLQFKIQPVTGGLHTVLSSVAIDSAILEQLEPSFPVGCNNAISDKAYRNELVIVMFNFMIQGALKQVRIGSKRLLDHLHQIACPTVQGFYSVRLLCVSFYMQGGVLHDKQRHGIKPHSSGLVWLLRPTALN